MNAERAFWEQNAVPGVYRPLALERFMTRTTQDLKVEISRLNRLIARIESKPNDEWTAWSSTLHDLVEERELLGLVVLNRRIEASKRVVSFRRWRDGPWAPEPAAGLTRSRRATLSPASSAPARR
jgi:hypothetical protein